MFYCQFCKHQTVHLVNHLSHQRLHRNITDNLLCCYNKCKKSFRLEVSLRSHVSRVHYYQKTEKKKVQDDTVVNSQGKFVCSITFCKKQFEHYSNFIKHLKTHIERGINVQCPFESCEKAYNNLSSFTGHMSRKHRAERPDELRTQESDSALSNFSSHPFVQHSENINCSEVVDDLIPETLQSIQREFGVNDFHPEDSEDLFLLNIAQLYLKLESQFILPVSTLQYIITEFCNVHQESQGIVKSNLKERLLQENMAEEVVNSIIEEVFSNDPFVEKNKLLETNYKRKEFYKKNFAYVEPIQIKLPSEKSEKKYFHYVPIEETIKCLFLDKNLEDKFSDIREIRDNGVLKDFTDGRVYLQNKGIQENPEALILMGFQDAFETVNPLGAAKVKHKVIGIYLNFLNLPEHLRSHINTIKLVGLVKEKDFNHEIVYGKIVEDLIKLQSSGVKVCTNKIVKAVLLFMVGDNLGSHSLGGFTENFSRAEYFCRYCLVSRGLFEAENGEFGEYPLRTVDSYNAALKKIKDDDLEIYQGVKFDSAFNRLPNFHVCNPGLPPCWGHDGFEGVIAYDLKLFINYFIRKGWFSLKVLNSRIEQFPYSIEDRKDKPCKISATSKKMAGGACQVWQFLRLFPLMVSDKIKDLDDEVWYLVISLSEITEIICAPEIHESYLPYLQGIINEYLSLRVSKFPKNKLRPKHHYIQHYPYLIKQFGPLMKVWSLRFESKHTYFKRVTRTLHNFINLTKSLSVKHEMFMSYLRLGADIREDVQLDGSGEFHGHIYCKEIMEALKAANLPSSIQECNSIVIKGTTYKKGNVIVLCASGYQRDIAMGRICIFLHDDYDNIYFVLEVLKIKYHPTLRCYELAEILKYECCALNRCIRHEPLNVYTIGNFVCVKPKYGFVVTGL